MPLTIEQEQLALRSIVAELGEADLDRIVAIFNQRYYSIHREWAKELLDAAAETSVPASSLLCTFTTDTQGALHVQSDPGKLFRDSTSRRVTASQPEQFSLIGTKHRKRSG
jgi:hypothetical protein